MDVHASHLHNAPGKKFKHYLFEFFMLFFAVFCGFLAENFREHIIERKWERRLMHSLVDDLKSDTVLLARTRNALGRQTRGIDSVLSLLPQNTATDEHILKLFQVCEDHVVWKARARPADRTVSQLKNAGFMRLIEHLEVSNAILGYEETKNRLIGQENDYMEAVNLTGESDKKLFNFVYLYPFYEHPVDPGQLPRFPKHVFNSSFIEEFGDNLYVEKLEVQVYIDRIDDTYRGAAALIDLIKKAYQIED
jgi:hypothetical protein